MRLLLERHLELVCQEHNILSILKLVLLKCVYLSETVRQMLGLEEEQVVEISGDNAKYEVTKCERNLKLATGEKDGKTRHVRHVCFSS